MLKNTVLAILSIVTMMGCSSMNKNNKDQSSTNNKLEDKSPALTSPKVRKVWVPEKIEGDKFIEGHWM